MTRTHSKTAPLSKCLQAALRYLEEHKWKMFPARITKDGKKYSWLSAQYAPGHENWGMTDDPIQLCTNFSNDKWRDLCGVGLPTGATNKIFVLEADTPKGHGVDGLAALKRLEAEHGKLPKTLMARSPTGSLHHYFNYPQGIKVRGSIGVIAEGVDIKSDGGMVVAAPSVRPGVGVYKWVNKAAIADAPEWLLAVVRDHDAGDAGNDRPHEGNGHAEQNPWTQQGEDQTSYPEPTVEQLMACAVAAPNNLKNWNDWNKVAMSIASAFPNDDGFAALDLWSRKWPKYDAKKTREKWKALLKCPPRSADEGGVTIGTFFSLGNQGDPGWRARLRGTQGSSRAPMPEERPWPVMDTAAFHGLAGEVVELFEPHTEADPVAILMQFLVYFGNAVDRGAYHLIEGDEHHGNLFAVLVGDTAKARKGTSASRIRQLMMYVDPIWLETRVKGGLSSGEGVIWEIRDAVNKTNKDGVEVQVVDPVFDKRLLADEREFAQVLSVMRREGNTLSVILREAWDGHPLNAITKNSPARCSRPHVSCAGHITIEELVRAMDDTNVVNGFANRFLLALVTRSKELPFGSKLDKAEIKAVGEKIQEAYKFCQTEREITMEEEGSEVGDLWKRVYGEMTKGKPGMFGAVTARSDAQTKRLALMYAMLDQSDSIEVVHLKAALAVVRYCEASAAYIFGDSLGDRVADEILRALRSSGEMSRTDLYRLFACNMSSNKIGAALVTLAKYGRARSEMRPQPQGKGRPTEVWIAT